ncbi:MAG: bifunctional 4-hydroxy-2-oxoglutarate aldolase/2-dehydro-3-deoxy-phosphogluconate aldolase [Chitinophagaceae bacterium]
MFSILTQQPIVAAVLIPDPSDAIPVTEALHNGGLKLIEITLRNDIALQSIRTIVNGFPRMLIGAGTILNTTQLHQAIDAGASFGLSPSLNRDVLKEASRLNFPFIPGVMTPSEIETAHGLGYTLLKLFPAASIGGISFLKSMLGPYAHLHIQFIPMGGINVQNMKDYLQLENVTAVGGSWLASPELIKNKRYSNIEENTREALRICESVEIKL